jgi:very-short-patch-repair endonuclease
MLPARGGRTNHHYPFAGFEPRFANRGRIPRLSLAAAHVYWRFQHRPRPPHGLLPSLSPSRLLAFFAVNAAPTSSDTEGDRPVSPQWSSDDDTDDSHPVRASLDGVEQRFNDVNGIEAAIDAARVLWPEWTANSFWLVTPKGTYIDASPSPDEAVRVLRGLGDAMTRVKRRSSSGSKDVGNDASQSQLVKGLVECLRLTAPRVPSAVRKTRKMVFASEQASKVLSDEGVSLAMPALARFGAKSPEVWQTEMEALCERLPGLQCLQQSLTACNNVAFALSRMRHWTPHLPLIEARAVDVLSPLSSQGLTTPAVDDDAYDHNHKRQVVQALNCARCLASLGHVPRNIMAAVAPSLNNEKFVDGWPIHALADASWTLAVGNDVHSPAFLPLLAALQRYYQDGRNIPHTQRMMLHQFFLTARLLRPQDTSTWVDQDVEMLSKLLYLCEQAWQQGSVQGTRMVSPIQRQVLDSMRAMGYNHVILEGSVDGISVDILVPEERLVIEVDGPWHFASNRTNVSIGSTRWKRSLLTSRGWTVVNVEAYQLTHRVRGAAKRRAYLRQLIEKAKGGE